MRTAPCSGPGAAGGRTVDGGTFAIEQERELASSKHLVLHKPLDISWRFSLLGAPGKGS